MTITDMETVGEPQSGIIVYWIGDEVKPKQYGICFQGHINNIHRQSMAESVPLALDMIDELADNDLLSIEQSEQGERDA